ncbi:MAG: hypothetical protein AAF865_08700 [Pseudomonadota bacterium]
MTKEPKKKNNAKPVDKKKIEKAAWSISPDAEAQLKKQEFDAKTIDQAIRPYRLSMVQMTKMLDKEFPEPDPMWDDVKPFLEREASKAWKPFKIKLSKDFEFQAKPSCSVKISKYGVSGQLKFACDEKTRTLTVKPYGKLTFSGPF